MAFPMNSGIKNIITINNNFSFQVAIKELWGNFQPLAYDSNINKLSTDIALPEGSYQAIADFDHLLIVPETLLEMRSKEMNFLVFDDVEESAQILTDEMRVPFDSQQ